MSTQVADSPDWQPSYRAPLDPAKVQILTGDFSAGGHNTPLWNFAVNQTAVIVGAYISMSCNRADAAGGLVTAVLNADRGLDGTGAATTTICDCALSLESPTGATVVVGAQSVSQLAAPVVIVSGSVANVLRLVVSASAVVQLTTVYNIVLYFT